MSEDKQEPKQVITKKNEGRVAAGKRLAAWNRNNKENLHKNQSESGQVLEGSTWSSTSASTSPSTSSAMLGAAAVAGAIVIAAGVWYARGTQAMRETVKTTANQDNPAACPEQLTKTRTAPTI